MVSMAGAVFSTILRAFFSCLVLLVVRRQKTLRMPMFSWFHVAKTWVSTVPKVCGFCCVVFPCVGEFNTKPLPVTALP